MFIKLGYRVILFTEELNKELEYDLPNEVIRVVLPVSYAQNRAEVFLDNIIKYNISKFCHHATSSPRLLFDLILLHEVNINTIITLHGTAPYFMALNGYFPFNPTLVYKLADTVLTLSQNEMIFYRQCGVNTYYMPNPVVNLHTNMVHNKHEQNKVVLWCGRLYNEQKNYKDALKIFKNIILENDKVVCYIIGSGNKLDQIYVQLFILFNRLQNKIIHIPYTQNLNAWYQKADVHLVTSSFETFPMVIVESKAHGLPLVTYDLPVVELLKDGKGYVSVYPHDIVGASNAVLSILNSKEYAEQLSIEAFESIQPFLKFNLIDAWSKILEDPRKKQVQNVSELNAENMRLFWCNTISMYHEGLANRLSIKKYIKLIIKVILKPILPENSIRRQYAVKLYHFFKKKILK